MQTLEESLAFLAEHVIATEYSFVVDMINSFPSCDSWIQWVLDETAYGAATIVAFRDCSNTEMLRDLRQLWTNCDLGAKSIKATKLS
jgi:hypothetical protein